VATLWLRPLARRVFRAGFFFGGAFFAFALFFGGAFFFEAFFGLGRVFFLFFLGGISGVYHYSRPPAAAIGGGKS
jgi:hypothetical protein